MTRKTKEDIIQEIRDRYPGVSLEKLKAVLNIVMKEDKDINCEDDNKTQLYFRPSKELLKDLLSKIANKN